MNLQLENKVAFITGSTSGIGFAIAENLLAEGASVIINGRSESSVDAALDRLTSAFPQGQLKGEVADFSDKEQIDALIQRLPKLDILINNVGVYTSKSFFETTDEDWFRQFNINVMSGVRLSRAILPQMLASDWGRIVFVSSECATIVPEDLISYSTTKTALLGVSRGLAQLTKGSKVTVNTVLPGSTLTEGAEQFLEDLAQREGITPAEAEASFFRDIRTSSLLQRFAQVREVADTITYLVSPLSSATNGAAIKIDGGSTGGIL